MNNPLGVAPKAPYATQCSNTGFDNIWTCPGCYTDMGNVGTGKHQCPQCGRQLECTLVHEPCCHTRLVEEGDE